MSGIMLMKMLRLAVCMRVTVGGMIVTMFMGHWEHPR
jgi:hypothetical protein